MSLRLPISVVLLACIVEFGIAANYYYRLSPMYNEEIELQSQGYPSANYSANTDDTVTIVVTEHPQSSRPLTAYGIKFSFVDFDLEYSSYCENDVVQVVEETQYSANDGQSLLKSYCGLQVGRTILTEGPQAYFRFYTNAQLQTRGFRVKASPYRIY